MIFVDVFEQLQQVAQIARKCPTPTLRNAYVSAMRDWCIQSRWLRTTITGATTADQQLYDLGSDPMIEILAIFEVSANDGLTPPNRWPLNVSDPTTWDGNQPSATPRRYTYVPEGQLALFPTPDAIYQIVAEVVVTPKGGVVKIPAAPLVKYGTTFEAGALEYLLAMKDTPWFNPNESMKQGKVYRSGISNAKAEAQRNFNSGAQRVVPRRFGLM